MQAVLKEQQAAAAARAFEARNQSYALLEDDFAEPSSAAAASASKSRSDETKADKVGVTRLTKSFPLPASLPDS